MPAKAIYRKKEQFDNGVLIEVVIWQLSEPIPGELEAMDSFERSSHFRSSLMKQLHPRDGPRR
ncbi:hypothetical protein [Halochromatium salexigens]|uniref:Uncharacterized protein n=1 Tax=Halochromatium salexigens TaxID=49447 RepID=A0AAJ0UGE3_HALSE|nr:hypothetical protein [Halochromatium salexigens]MBK5930818.1 hypothetical protein [Halochromatium salexigens]